MLGSILLAMASLQVGMVALTGALAGTCQGVTSFTQQNEQEADRIGIQVLQRSGFGPQVVSTFPEKLLGQARYSSCPSEILLTHSLPESHLTDVCSHANQMRPIAVQSSGDFYLAKVCALGVYNSGHNQLTSDLLDEWVKGSVRQQRATQYGCALQTIEANKYDEACKTLQPLLAAEPGNAQYTDLITDIGLEQNKTNDTINCPKNTRDLHTNPALQLNLTNAHL